MSATKINDRAAWFEQLERTYGKDPACIIPSITDRLQTATRYTTPRNRTMGEYAYKSQMLQMMAWEFADTVLDTADIVNNESRARLSSAMIKLRNEYVLYRSEFLNINAIRKMSDNTERFVDRHSVVLSHLNTGIKKEIAKFKLQGDEEIMVRSAMTALATVEAIEIYSKQVETTIAEFAQYPKALVGAYIRSMKVLLIAFCGDCYIANSKARRTAARSLADAMYKSILSDEQ